MRIEQGSWMRFLSRTLVLSSAIGVAAFVGVKLATASPGEPVRKALSVSGVLTGVPSPSMATFRFYRMMGDATPLCAPEVLIRDGMERDAATGAFSVEVPLDQSGTGRTCPDALFHDPSAYVEVLIGTTVVVTRRPINPVPYAVYAQQYGTPDCPVGYERDPSETGVVLCSRCSGPGRFENCFDNVVRVGAGPSAFWVDQYEATITEGATGGQRYGQTSDDLPAEFPDTGQWTVRRYALSFALGGTSGHRPTRFVTWFQAQAACRLSGKRLPTGEEWLAAALGSDDGLGTTSDGSDSRCVTNPSSSIAILTARRRCRSVWGAQDMIGNASEWTSEWFGATAGSDTAYAEWPLAFAQDTLVNFSPSVRAQAGVWNRVPAAALRGGSWVGGVGAGVFALWANGAPAVGNEQAGFRCVITR